MEKYKYGFCEWYLPFCGPSTLQFCKEMGYQGIQIGDMGGAAQNFPLTNPRLAEAYVNMSQKTGVELQCMDIISVIHDGSLRADPDSDLGQLSVLAMKKAFEACKLMGITSAFIPSVLKTRIENRSHYLNTVENLRRGKLLADEMGVELLYESFSPVGQTKEICEKSGGIKLMYDTLNPMKYGFGENSAEEILSYGTQWIHTIHFKDCNPAFSSDVPFGNGVGMVAECAKAIKEIGYTGWIVNENTYFHSDRVAQGADPWELGARDLETLRGLLEN